MKKIFLVVFACLILALSFAQSSEATSLAYGYAVFPNYNEVAFLPYYMADGVNNWIITFDGDNSAYLSAVTADGWPVYHLWTPDFVTFYCSSDGFNWSGC